MLDGKGYLGYKRRNKFMIIYGLRVVLFEFKKFCFYIIFVYNECI